MAQRSLSELESCVLALIGSNGPSTPYAIRQEFLNSLSPQWSGSAGAIYPLVQRMERQKLVRSTKHSTGRREGQLLSLTPAGTRAVQAWLRPDWPDWVVGVPPDPLRTRIDFLGMLPTRVGRKFLQAAASGVEQQLSKIQHDMKRRKLNRGFDYWTARGAVLSMQARLRWLKEIAKALG